MNSGVPFRKPPFPRLMLGDLWATGDKLKMIMIAKTTNSANWERFLITSRNRIGSAGDFLTKCHL